jgi:hypothetical protein
VRILTTLAAALLATSCGRSSIDNKEAVRKGVVDYLEQRRSQTGLDMGLMNVEVTNVSFEKNEARATVAFRPKDGKAGTMSMNYVLERKDDRWVVKGRQESGLSPHAGTVAPGAMGGQPSGELPSMPLNHPPTAPPQSPASK